MDFKETYRHEVYLSRKDRSRRAFFAAKITGIALALTVGASLRASPELRSALMEAGMDGVARIAQLDQPTKQEAAAAAFLDAHLTAIDTKTATQPDAPSTLPPSRIKVNRPQTASPSQDDAGLLLQELSRLNPNG